MPSDQRMYSVVEVIRKGGWDYTKQLSWNTGRAASQKWQSQYGCKPSYEMRKKTLSKHPAPQLHAVYPESWLPEIEKILIRLVGYPSTDRRYQEQLTLWSVGFGKEP